MRHPRSYAALVVLGALALLAPGLARGRQRSRTDGCACGPHHGLMVASFDVNSVADLNDDTPGDGTCYNSLVRGCTLRAAVTEANALPGDDTMSLPAGTYVLPSAGPVEALNADGDLDITSNISINGVGRIRRLRATVILSAVAASQTDPTRRCF